MRTDGGRPGGQARPPQAVLQPRPWLEHIEPYRPGLPADSDDGSLASNESPFGASARVVTAITEAALQAHHYPDPLAGALRAELAALHGVHPDQILVGNGSDELIFLLAWAYLAQRGHAVCADPSYRIDEISTYLVGARLTRVPLRDWAHDLDAMACIAADITYLVNPHNPTGTVRSRAEIEHFLRASPAGLIVVDEAYVEFTDDPEATTCLPLVASGRVAVLRTFSKIHGLAGLRVGYLIADPGIITTLRKIRAPFSVGTLAQAGALAALGDPGHAAQVRARTLRARAELTRLFERAGYPVIPSQANFILVQAQDEHALVSRLAEHAIVVRPGTALGIPGTVRVSVPSQRGLRLLHSALRPTPGRRRPSHADARGPDHHNPAHGAAQRERVRRLRLVLEGGNHPPQPQITHHAPACRNPQRPRQRPRHRFRVRADSQPTPFPSNEHAIQHDPNEVIIGM